MALTAQQVQQFYIGYYGRPADPVGLTFWQTQTEAQALAGFASSAEFTNQFTGLSTSQQVTKVYGNLLGRTPDPAGLLYWSGEITAGRETIGSLVLSMIKNALGKDVTTIEDRVTYSTSFTAALNTTEEINAYAGTAATQAARDALLKVVATAVGDHTALNAETAKIDATIAAIVSGGGSNPGQTFTLTTGADAIPGLVGSAGTTSNAGDDTITGNVDTIANGGTYNAADVIDGGNGTDTLNLSISDNTKFAAGATVKNVEVLNIREVSAAPGALSLEGFTGLTEVWSKGSTQDAEVSNVQNAVTVGMASTAKNHKVGFAADKLGSATATQAVVLNGAITAAGAAVTLELDVAGADKITKMSVASNSAKSSVALKSSVAGTDVALTDLTVTGNAALTLAATVVGATGELNGLKTITATGMTAGGLTIDLSGQTADIVGMTFAGSAGDDKITVNAAHLTSKDTLSGAAGANTLGLNVATDTAGNSSLVAAGAAAGVTGFQTLAVTSTTTAVSGAAANIFTVDASAFAGVTKVALGSDLAANALNVIAVANLSDANTVSITAGQTGVVNATYKPAAIAAGTDLGLNLEIGAAKAAGITVANVAVTQTANLAIKSSGTSLNTITDLTATQNTALKTITVSGDVELKITNDLDVKGLTTIDARGLTLTKTTDNGLTLNTAITNGGTKGISIYGSNGVDTIKGSAVGDAIWGGLGADAITLGTAGKTDTVRYTATTESTSTAKDVVTVFEGARDLLKFEGITKVGNFSLQTTAFAAGGNASALIASTTLGAAQDVSLDFNGDGISDMVISLAGTGTLTAANFEFA